MNYSGTRLSRMLLLLAVCSTLANVAPVRAQSRLHRSDVTGTDFYMVFPRMAWGSQVVGALINSHIPQTVTLHIPRDTAHHLFITKPDTTVFTGGPFSIEYVPEIVRHNKVVHITTEYPVTMHGQYGKNAIGGTFTALPTSSWGKEYYVVNVPEGHNQEYGLYPTVYSVPTVTIIANKHETGVTIWPSTQTAKGREKGTPYTIAMDSGDVYTLSTAGDPMALPRNESVCDADLSGTHIFATKTIGVIVAQSHSAWPCGDNECGDYGVEWLAPMCSWDTLYAIPPSVPRMYDIGEEVRCVFGTDSTKLWRVNAKGQDEIIGMYMAGQFEDLSDIIGAHAPYVIHANHPFLPIEITKHPSDCVSGSDGGEPWTFSLSFPSGVHQWSDHLTYSSALTSTGNIAHFMFRDTDKKNLFFNGVPFTTAFPNSIAMAGGYSYVTDSTMEPMKYYEVHGINGAVAGGMVYGHGTSSYIPRSDDKGHYTPQGPLVIKSFGHPIGFNAIQLCSPDTIAPRDSVGFSCGHWSVVAIDDEVDPPAAGLNTITLMRETGTDSSYNVRFSPAPGFTYGDGRAAFGIDVVNLTQPAAAALRIRDGAGNELDTLLIYRPQVIDAVPALVNVGAIRAGDSISKCMVLKNRGNEAVTFTRARLQTGTSWRILHPQSPTAPFTLAAGDSANFCFEYTAPVSIGLECNPDTLLLTTCKEFPIAAMEGCNKRPAIIAQGYDFGELEIDTLGKQGTSATLKGMFVASVGSDVLNITGITFGGVTMAVPDSDFSYIALAPTNDHPWVLAPGDTQWITISAHPHHTGLRKAYLAFANDANGVYVDTAFMTVVGVPPPVGVTDNSASPDAPGLVEGYPNPFSGSATISFNAPAARDYAVVIYDNLGGEVARVIAEPSQAGRFQAHWNALHMRTGVYHYTIVDARTDQRVISTQGKIVILK